MQVRLKGGTSTVTLTEVDQDDDQAVIGTTKSGKRFVALREQIAEPVAEAHPYRVYLKGGHVLRVVDPAFADMEAAYLTGNDHVELVTEGGEEQEITTADILSLLSAAPEDLRAAEAVANGNVAVAEEDEEEGVHPAL
jgi:hypothetical protein